MDIIRRNRLETAFAHQKGNLSSMIGGMVDDVNEDVRNLLFKFGNVLKNSW